MVAITSEVIKDLILFLEENECEQFEIRYSGKGVVYYEPIEDEEESIQLLWDITGKDVFYEWTEWVYDILIEEYENSLQ